MKKNNLITGILYTIFGILFLLAALLTETRLDSLFFGLSGAGILPGILMIYQYFYWNSPGNREQYAERLEQEHIELHDELKTKLRDKSGRYAYILGMLLISVSMLAFTVLGELGILAYTRSIIIYLGFYLLFQYIAGILIFRHLLRKYQ